MPLRLYTKEQLVEVYAGRYIKVEPIYDPKGQRWLYEVLEVSQEVREGFRRPEDCVIYPTL